MEQVDNYFSKGIILQKTIRISKTADKSLAKNHSSYKGSPFLKCVAFIWVFPVRGYKGLARMVWDTFFHVAQGCKGLPGWFGALFSTFACLTKGGGSKAIWAML